MKKLWLIPCIVVFLIGPGISGCSKPAKVQTPQSTYPAPVPSKAGATNLNVQSAS